MVGVEELFPDQGPSVLEMQRQGERDLGALDRPGPSILSIPGDLLEGAISAAKSVGGAIAAPFRAVGQTLSAGQDAVTGLLSGLAAVGRNLVPLAYLGLGVAGLYLVARLRGR